MRWRVPRPKPTTEMPWWVWLLMPLWGPPFALLFASFGALWCKRWLMGPSPQWRPWFAWVPITIETEIDGEVWPIKERVWLEWVERRAGHVLGDAEYRLLPHPKAGGLQDEKDPSGRVPSAPGSRADAPSRCASRPAASIPSRTSGDL